MSQPSIRAKGSAAEEPNPIFALRRGDVVGRYVLLERLGAGGMGAVYTAYDPELDRKVALKLLRADVQVDGPSGEARARLLREAQALARLSHEHVISVHDVGTYHDSIFVAMEYIDGGNLTAWLLQKRTTEEILRIFVLAGRGLHAAHGAGLVHRDFKPDNVLLGKDGRVCVADFGLARTAKDAELKGGAPIPVATLSQRLLLTPLTQAGTVMGTMEYMAPEQFTGKEMDARTDQFSFCVALWESLYKARPFGGDDYHTLAQNVIDGNLVEPPRDAHVPARVRRVLTRGMSTDPARRYPTMAELLDALSYDPRVARRRYLIAGAGALAVLLLIGGYLQIEWRRARLCEGGEGKLAGIWDEARRESMKRAFLATSKPYAAMAWEGASLGLSGYARSWVAMYRDACLATRERGEQSEQMLDLRMQCLGDRLKELEALSALFEKADAQVVEKAVQAARGLSSLDGCADPAALRAQVAPPADPDRREKVEELRKRLAHAKVLEYAGRYKEGIEVASQALVAARPLGYLPIEAEALYALGDLEGEAGSFDAARETLTQAVVTAEAGRHDKLVARAAARLVSLVGYQQARHAEGRVWGQLAQAKLSRMGGDVVVEAKLLNSIGLLDLAEGRPKDAAERMKRAVELRTRASGPEHPLVAESVNNLGEALYRMGRSAESLSHYKRALAIWEKALGPAHPSLARSLERLGVVMSSLGQHEEALGHIRRALALRRQALSADHPDLARTLISLGQVALLMGDDKDARASYEEARAISEKALGAKHPVVAQALLGLAQAQADKAARALPLLERAHLICVASRCDPLSEGHINLRLAGALKASRKSAHRALELARRAEQAFVTLGPQAEGELAKARALLGPPAKGPPRPRSR